MNKVIKGKHTQNGNVIWLADSHHHKLACLFDNKSPPTHPKTLYVLPKPLHKTQQQRRRSLNVKFNWIFFSLFSLWFLEVFYSCTNYSFIVFPTCIKIGLFSFPNCHSIIGGFRFFAYCCLLVTLNNLFRF